MKHFRLILPALLMLCFSSGSAQLLRNRSRPDVIFTHRGGTEPDSAEISKAIEVYYATIEKGFRQTGLPRFVISGKNQKMMFGIGGNVDLRASYDFAGSVSNRDFVTSSIPVPGSDRTRQQFRLDPSASTLFFKAIARAGRIGPIVGYIQFDFRNADYAPSLQIAYVDIAGFSLGRRFTTFCDLNATPSTVDFEGPNGYPMLYSDMIRYTRRFGGRWSIAVAAEMPRLSASFAPGTSSMPQRMPDFPMYVQYDWDKSRSHLRASALLRNMFYYDDTAEKHRNEFGWGAQISGSVRLGNALTAYFQYLYGEGIAAYIQDIAGSGLDLVPDPRNPLRLQTLPMTSWIAGFQYVFSPRWTATAVYSGVGVESRNGYDDPSSYKRADYLSVNLFCNLFESCQIGLSYLYGTRRNLSGQRGEANRIQTVVQYNF